MKKNPLIIMFSIFFGLGIIFLGVTYAVYKLVFIPEEYREYIKATIIEINTETDSDGDTVHRAVVGYQIDGVDLTQELSSYSSSYRVGKEIHVYLDTRKNSTKLHTNVDNVVFIPFGIIGSAFSLIGFIGLIVQYLGRKRKNRLKESGMLVNAKYLETIRPNVQINGVYPYVVKSEWINPADGITYVFKSEYLMSNPELEEKGIKDIPVYVNDNNPKEYYVDVDQIL